jgi:hypothetical protein
MTALQIPENGMHFQKLLSPPQSQISFFASTSNQVVRSILAGTCRKLVPLEYEFLIGRFTSLSPNSSPINLLGSSSNRGNSLFQ